MRHDHKHELTTRPVAAARPPLLTAAGPPRAALRCAPGLSVRGQARAARRRPCARPPHASREYEQATTRTEKYENFNRRRGRRRRGGRGRAAGHPGEHICTGARARGPQSGAMPSGSLATCGAENKGTGRTSIGWPTPKTKQEKRKRRKSRRRRSRTGRRRRAAG